MYRYFRPDKGGTDPPKEIEHKYCSYQSIEYMLYLKMLLYYYTFTHGHHTCTDRARTRAHVHGH